MILTLEKNTIPLAKIAPVKSTNLSQVDLKNVECIGFQEEKTLMLMHGDHLANVNIIANNMMSIIL